MAAIELPTYGHCLPLPDQMVISVSGASFRPEHAVQVADKLPINFHDGDMRGIGQELKGITAAAGDKVAGALGAVNAATDSLARPQAFTP